MTNQEIITEALLTLVRHQKDNMARANQQMITDKNIFLLLAKVIELSTPKQAAIEVIEHVIRTSEHNFDHMAITEVRDWYNNSPEWT